MKFRNTEHETLYKALLEKDNTHPDDMERKALFYLLALIGGNVDKFYRFDGRYITPDANAPELTSTGKRALYLAFELFNGYSKNDKLCSVNQIMSGAGSYAEYFIEAMKIRYCGA